MPTTKSNAKKNAESFEQSVIELRERFEELNRQKIKIQTQCESVKENLDELKKSAREQFGTDDLAELKKQLKKMNAENDKKREKYEKDLEAIEKSLNEIDQSLDEEE